ncbi:DNA gyrase subunit A [Marinitoga sp. 1135]|uniref:DNA topoisomerase (ATP-hydrolyzing) n=1 Tax=Marinitoga piezophila (strain DSM 14283 / JCM 11233 / KA3) TaxID=443254 RepID=H2J6N9_MARPK|nr:MULTISPECIES: DNA gyrase subunit A [Marinitoga]AEX86320.1 DNA gyrase, A subunit [Marinitoga piezophila KA3]APT76721.1 DNA gyrase subunit A [Marinitoga sp. 1137]NUU96498.1 DNA gyrase subunit A [Marinitoga sp. 1135]NUU98417.1 DNA gyrase subunit A [Marinitoga sp. 1138]
MSEILNKSFEEELKESYLLYSLSVITSRAIPDVRDGLKPVQRRILYSMDELNLKHNAAYKKCARIVGEVMGKYHPHGDAAIYDALVRMAQPFSLRYPLVIGQGNFGSIDKDPAAAMRYTEAKMHELAEYMLMDIDKNTVEMMDNFDGSLKEPWVLPTRLPNLLMNGVNGIAVGMATNIPSHNLTELAEGIKYLIDNPDASVEELMKFIKGPDLPTGGIIVDGDKLKDIYETGRGTFHIRSKYEFEENKNGMSIVIKEIPYGVSKADLITQIANYVTKQKENKKDVGIRNIRDESDKEGIRVVIELKKNVNPQRVVNQLLKHTQMQISFPVQMTVIDNRKPRVMNLKEILQAFINHRVDVITRRTQFELDKARKRSHIVEGLMKASEGIEAVIEIIRQSEGREEAINSLMEIINVTKEQANAIVDMRLISLSKLEGQKLEKEYAELTEKIKIALEILNNREKLMEIIKEETEEIKLKFGDERRTVITNSGAKIEESDNIEEEDLVIVLTQWGYIKAMKSSEYKVQNRGGKGAKAIKKSDNDFIIQVLQTNSLSKLLFITSKGKAFELNAYKIEKSSKDTKGKHISTYLYLENDEKIKTIIPIENKKDIENKYIMLFTKKGTVKRTALEEFSNIRRNGLKAITIKEDDTVVDALIVEEKDEVLVISAKGMSLRFRVSDVRPMGRSAAGVRSIKLRENDEVVNAVMVDNEKSLLLITKYGFAKRVDFKDFRLQNRGGVGLKCVKETSRIGDIVKALAVTDESHVIVFTKLGKAIREEVSTISSLSRYAIGVRAIRLDKEDIVADAAVVIEDE